MPILDFTEIAKANGGDGKQDSFELFAEEFLKSVLGYKILEGPGRGADGGKDLVVAIESTATDGYKTDTRALVSCKHFAHADKGQGRAVSTSDENNLRDRVENFGCTCFIAFYSTLPTQVLSDYLKNLSPRISHRVVHGARIEELLVGYPDREQLFLRYFPSSYKRWKELHYYREPVELFNYYFRQVYSQSIQRLVNVIFGPPENMLKHLRLSNSFADLVAKFEQNLCVVVEPRLGEYGPIVLAYLGRLNESFTQKLHFKNVDPSSIEVAVREPLISAQELPHELRGSLFDLNDKQSWILIASRLTVTTELDEKLNTMFLDLKSKV